MNHKKEVVEDVKRIEDKCKDIVLAYERGYHDACISTWQEARREFLNQLFDMVDTDVEDKLHIEYKKENCYWLYREYDRLEKEMKVLMAAMESETVSIFVMELVKSLVKRIHERFEEVEEDYMDLLGTKEEAFAEKCYAVDKKEPEKQKFANF